MKKTCYNCKHYHTICDEATGEHWHDFCDAWRSLLDTWAKHSLEWYASWDCAKDKALLDDLETGEAECYLFDPREEPAFSDAWFESNAKYMQDLQKQIEEELPCKQLCID